MALETPTGIDFGGEFDFTNSLVIPDDCSFSFGNTVETSTRFSKDYTRTSQTTTRCRRPMARTFSISYTLARPFDVDLFEALAKTEDAVGKLGTLYYTGLDFGKVIITSATFALEPDIADGISSIGVSLEISAAIEPKKPSKRLKPKTYRG